MYNDWFDLFNATVLTLEASASTRFAVYQPLYRLEGKFGAHKDCIAGSASLSSRYYWDLRGLQHIQVGFFNHQTQEFSYYLGHNMEPTPPSCEYTFYPKLHTHTAGPAPFPSLEEAQRALTWRMHRLASAMHGVVDALLCRQEIRGYDLKWYEDNPERQGISVTRRATRDRLSIHFFNKNTDPVPEGLAVYFNGDPRIELRSDSDDLSIPIAEQFSKVFTKKRNCPPQKSEQPEEGVPDS